MRRFVSLLLILSVCGLSALPQTKPRAIKRVPEIEPFRIERGTSFSASTSKSEPVKQAKPFAPDRITSDVAEAIEIIRQNYVDPRKSDYDSLVKSSIEEMLHTLDPHSNYYDGAEFQELLTDQQSEYFGIGATISNYTKNGSTDTFVVATFPDSPANRAGLRFGDRIVLVNGENVSGKDSSYVRDKVRGRKGTIARVTVERSETGRLETFELRRNRVPQPSIPDAYILRPGVGYVDMSEGFNYTTAEELGVALAELKKQGMTSLVLDLRDNTGGILDQAVKVAEKFLPFGSVVVTQRGRFAIDNRTWKAADRAPETMPLVVLVDEQTASASEIVSGALQDYDRALIIGENTFGKGLVQSILSLPFGSGLTLTTAKYYTPSGRSIQRDYSHAGLYDYFNHKTTEPRAKRVEARTLTGRSVFSGDGIAPDEVVKAETLDRAQVSLLDPIFFFSKELARGNVAGLENFRISGPPKYGQRVRPIDLTVDDAVFESFSRFIESNPEWRQLLPTVRGDRAYVKLRIRYNLITAAFGTVSAKQILIENDNQVGKAIENLPRAQQLAQLAERTRQKRGRQ
ncbi:MAG: S41 family peptidase [Acidobacteria bacterium]|nr:S41 family peptidase [Acidobacteriota bacterium]